MTLRPESIARGGALAFATAMAGLVLYVMLARFGYPHELEWMTGSILDHVERVRRGEPIYVAPSVDWTPFIYTPGYYWASALLSHIVPEVAACRGISIASALVAAGCAYPLARRARASGYFAGMAPLLFLGCFGLTCAWYDIERSDSLFVALVALGALLSQSPRAGAWLAGGVVVGASFFVKQPGTTFAVIVPAVLALTGRARRAAWFGAGALVGLVPPYLALQAATGGWFGFYCLAVPSAHGIAARFAPTFFVADLAKGPVLTLTTIGALAGLARATLARWRRAQAEGRDEWTVLAAFLAAGFVASALSRMHVGGWANVLMFWTTFACPAAAVLATRLDDGARPGARVALSLGLALQTGAAVPDPNDSVPDAKAARHDAAIAARVHELEASAGEVLLLSRGHVTTRRHLHINALIDVLRAGRPLPDDLRAAVSARGFGAIVLNEIGDLQLTEVLGHESELFELVTRRYFVAERLDDRTPPPVVGFPTVPKWVLRARRTPLDALGHDELLRRQRVEMGLAERNMRAVQASPGLRLEGLEIEDEAAREARAER